MLAEARFLLARALGLAHRALASLRTRGWRASWSRALRQWSPARLPPSALYRPADAAFTPFAVPFSATPRASIVIPVYGQCAHTLACLRAIAAHPPAAPIDVIIVDDGSIDDTAQLLPRVDGLRYHRRAANGGFIAASNDGAALARGGFLVFLNNDTVPQPGWLDALLDTFAGQAGAGLVGAQLLYPDGRLQEAGGVVFSDGSAWNYGRFGDPSDPRYGYVRDADYLSAAAVAIPRDLFERLGGFDTRYAPAYYEDTDLAFAVRAAGLRTLYQPRARVLHDEGTSAGTDPRQGMKAAQVRNREVFAAKWAAALPSRLPPGSEPTPALLHRGQKQVLVIDALAPQPDRDSGSLRLVNLMRLLRGEGAHVVFLPANREHGGRYTEALQQLGVEAWYAPHARRAPGWLREHGHRFHSVLACRHYVAREFLPLLRAHAPQARVVFDSVDLHYLRERRAAELRGGAAQRRAALRTRALELGVIAASDATLVVSEAERALLATDAPSARVEVLSNLHEVAGPGKPFAERKGLVFVGGFRHPPNADAVRWFVSEVFPLVRARLPGIPSTPSVATPADIAASRAGRRRIHGLFRDRAMDDGCRIAVRAAALWRRGEGKVNLSMAHGQPVVATPAAVEGMHLRDGEDVLVGADAAAFADAIVRLHGDQALWEQLATGGLANVARHFSMDAARETVRSVLL